MQACHLQHSIRSCSEGVASNFAIVVPVPVDTHGRGQQQALRIRLCQTLRMCVQLRTFEAVGNFGEHAITRYVRVFE